MRAKRKIIQMVVNPISEHNPYDELWTLCDDGTVWRRYEYGETVDGQRETKQAWTKIETSQVETGR